MLLDYDRRLPETEKQQHLRSIDRATDRLTELVDHLLDMSRMDAGLMKLERVPADISVIIEEAVSDARLTAPAGKVISHMRNELPPVTIDARRIRQVLDNLIDNAIKYSGSESSVLIEAECTDSTLCVSVADEGIGIPPEDIEKVFDRMYRAEQRLTQGSKGLGLGLSVCRGMVEAHGGKIWAESQVGVGSTFYFTLPLVNEGEGEGCDNVNPHN
jgi:signal transduction histidine kinase